MRMIKFLIFELDKIFLQAIMHNSIYVTITGLKCQYVKKMYRPFLDDLTNFFKQLKCWLYFLIKLIEDFEEIYKPLDG